MFEDISKTYGFDEEEEEIYLEIMMGDVLNVFSPFEVDKDMDFPKKDELGGIVLKFIGGGAAYFKLQKEMPSDEEVKDVYNVCQFLKESLGDYVAARIMCQPHIEIRGIDVSHDDSIDVCYVSVRLNDGDKVLEKLCEKLKNKEGFTYHDNIQRFILPFMGRKNRGEFKNKYSKFISQLDDAKRELPNEYRLTRDVVKDNLDDGSMLFNHIY